MYAIRSYYAVNWTASPLSTSTIHRLLPRIAASAAASRNHVTDNGGEFCGNDSHPYELCLARFVQINPSMATQVFASSPYLLPDILQMYTRFHPCLDIV